MHGHNFGLDFSVGCTVQRSIGFIRYSTFTETRQKLIPMDRPHNFLEIGAININRSNCNVLYSACNSRNEQGSPLRTSKASNGPSNIRLYSFNDYSIHWIEFKSWMISSSRAASRSGRAPRWCQASRPLHCTVSAGLRPFLTGTRLPQT